MSGNQSLDAAVDRVRDVLERQLAACVIAGAVVLVAQGERAHVVAVGTKAAGAGDPMGRDTIFRLASMTKPIIAAAAMVLVEDGRLQIEESIDRLLPELARPQVLKRMDGPVEETVPANRPITVLDLLSFCCGLGMLPVPPGTYPIQHAIEDAGLTGFLYPDRAAPLDPDEWMRRLGRLPLMAQPGETWIYNAGSNLLGVLIARLEGRPLAQVLEDRIFAPLGMRDTGFFVPEGKRSRLATFCRPGSDGLEPVVLDQDWGQPPIFPAGDSGLVSTIDDFFKFSRMFSRPGRPGPLAASSIRAMTVNQLTIPQRPAGDAILGPERGWSCGMGVQIAMSPEGLPAGGFGWDGGYGTSWRVDPGTDRTVIVLTQTSFAPPTHKELWSAVFRP